MRQKPNPIYCPALRLKAGELEGVRQLAGDVAEYVLPRFILLPRSERDETQPMLIEAAEVPDISAALRTHWRDRPALVDVTYIINEYDRDCLLDWLPPMFERARKNQVRAIPLAFLNDLEGVEPSAFRASIAHDEQIKFAIALYSNDMVGNDFGSALNEALNRLGLTPEVCVVLVDFGGSEFGDPAIVAPIINDAMEKLQDFGRWQLIIFQGSHYPEHNPAKDGSVEIWPRNEWLAWRQAVNFDPATTNQMIFGDYAADCAKIVFGANNAAAIRHIRYATTNTWRIQRAVKYGNDMHRMHGVYRAIFKSDDFAGTDFSEADTYIARAANDATAKPGNATTWRQLNTTRHISQVVADIARVRGFSIQKTLRKDFDKQLSLVI